MKPDLHPPPSAPDAGPAQRGWLSLRFADPALEAAFKHDYFRRSLLQVRISLILGGLLYAVFGLLDPWIIPGSTAIAWWIRYALVCPLIVGVFALSFAPCFERCMAPAMVVVGLAASLGILVMIGTAAAPGSYLYYAGLLLAAMFIYTFMRLRFVPASAANWGMAALYGGVAWTTGTTPHAILINNSFFLVSINIVGMSACYYMERYARADFLKRGIIRRQTARLETALAEVEKARGQAEEQSRRDALTGLFNRRHFQDILAVELERARRAPSPTSLILMDVDKFKGINDTHGHATGDRVLRRVAEQIGLGLRRPDVACRYGGEEFTVLLPGSDSRSAENVAERLRSHVEDITATALGEPVSVTISLGVATIPAGERWDADTLIDRADQALYAAKKAGRNRVSTWRTGTSADG